MADCLRDAIEIEKCCEDLKCIYLGACINRFNGKIPGVTDDTTVEETEEIDSDTLGAEHDETGFQVKFEEDEYVEDLENREDEDFYGNGRDDDGIAITYTKEQRQKKTKLIKETAEADKLKKKLDQKLTPKF